MRILVTGATGFLGGAVARRLLKDGQDVTATGRDPVRGAALSAEGLPFVRADLTDAAAGPALVTGVEVVVHCAALSAPWGAYARFAAANVDATRTVLAAARRAGVARFVHVSTPSLYMGAGSRFDVREGDPLPPPINAYAATKREAELLVAEAARAGLPAVVLRPRAIFGPGDTTIFPRLLRAMRTGRLPVIGDGSNVVDLTYVDNVVDAVWLACTAPLAGDGLLVCNVTNGEPVRLWALLGDLAGRLGYPRPSRRVPRGAAMLAAHALEAACRWTRAEREPILTRYGVSVLADSLTLNIESARRRLGYAAQVSVRDGLERFVASLGEGA